ncbi:ABA4-like family protein [Tellurirhabdus rosea]|uniref:ABA4-like family protein n=1 Tax=Tellurirhabdus rosea TaxID=2674997 RepID=UPI00225168D0|nr:ABA4-like family protein [Tellurirhabdus rosea]
MNTALAFQLANALVLPQWLLMIFAPRWQPTRWLMRHQPIPALLALFYLYFLFFGTNTNNLALDSFNTLAGVKALFTSDAAVLAGWIHYLAFDLVAGTYILRSGRRRRIPHGLLVPCLLLCFLLGPTGFLIYWIIRKFYKRSYSRSDHSDED